MATTYYLRSTGGNHNTSETWSTVSSASAVNTGTYPVAGDTEIHDAGSGNCTLTAAAAATKLYQTGYLGNLAFGANVLTVSGNVTRGGTSTYSGAGGITVNAAATITGNGTAFGERLTLDGAFARAINSNGSVWGTVAHANAAAAIILQSFLKCINFITSNNYSSINFTGPFDIEIDNAQLGDAPNLQLQIPAGQTFTVNTSIKMINNNSPAMESKTAGSPAYFVFKGVLVDCVIANVAFTDIFYSGTSVPILDNLHGRTLLRVNNAQFTCRAAYTTAGAVYSHNGQTYTVDATIAGTTTLKTTCQVRAFPYNAGVLTKVSGTGDSTIAFSNVLLQGIRNVTSADIGFPYRAQAALIGV